jgi:hypothetical protein
MIPSTAVHRSQTYDEDDEDLLSQYDDNVDDTSVSALSVGNRSLSYSHYNTSTSASQSLISRQQLHHRDASGSNKMHLDEITLNEYD